MFKNVFVAMMLTWSVGQAWADVIVSVQNGTIAAGGTGYVDVYIRSSGRPFQMSSTSYYLEITGSATNGDLVFRPDAEQTPEQQNVTGAIPYVFYSDTDSNNWFAIRQPTATELIGGDSTASSSDITVGATDLLLARLQLQHTSGTAAPAIGDTFTIALKNDPSQTYFKDSGSSFLDIDSNSYSNMGTITIIAGASAVPEPAGILASVAAVAATATRSRRRGRC